MRIVLDTNVLVSALITRGTPPDQLYRAWEEGVFDLVTSRAQLDELRRVLGYEKLRRYVERAEAEALLDTVDAVAVVVDDLPEVHLSPDPDDNLILATAIAGKADLIVSGDRRDLVALGEAQGIPILTAGQAVERLESTSR